MYAIICPINLHMQWKRQKTGKKIIWKHRKHSLYTIKAQLHLLSAGLKQCIWPTKFQSNQLRRYSAQGLVSDFERVNEQKNLLFSWASWNPPPLIHSLDTHPLSNSASVKAQLYLLSARRIQCIRSSKFQCNQSQTVLGPEMGQ